MTKQTRKYYFVATKEEECFEWYKNSSFKSCVDNGLRSKKIWTIDNTSGSPHDSRKEALEEMEYFKGSFPTKLIVVKSNEDINSSKEANENIMDKVNYKIELLNV